MGIVLVFIAIGLVFGWKNAGCLWLVLAAIPILILILLVVGR